MKNVVFLLLVGLSLISCISKSSLELLQTIKLNITEPSGITAFNNNLYIVSDKNGAFYKVSLGGEILKKFNTKFNDLEGITIQESSHNFWLVEESERKLVKLDSLGNYIQKFKIKGKQHSNNNGLEGVCFVESENALYVINENSPKQVLQLNLKGEIINKFKLDFSKDISGICFDKRSNSFWIVSDESKSVYNISKKGALIKSYKIPVNKAEGIVIYNNKMYVVSDSENNLYIFKTPI